MTIPRKPRSIDGTASHRFRRVPPLRTEPLRQWPGALRSSAPSVSPNGNGLAQAMPQGFQAASDLGFDGIGEGYRLIEQHIRRAREAATGRGKTLGRRKSSSNNDEDVRAVIAQVFQSLSELLPIVGDLFNRLGAEGITRFLTSSAGRTSIEASASAMTEAGSRVRIEISSRRHADARLELRPNAEKLKLLAHPLIRGDSKGAIKTLRFSPAKRRTAPTLSIRIPVRQPPGTYAAAVVDSRSGEPQGVLTVHVRK